MTEPRVPGPRGPAWSQPIGTFLARGVWNARVVGRERVPAEGNRGRGDASSARAGVAWLAVHGTAPVVPVAILGTRRTGESVGHIPGFRRRLHIEFGEPVQVERGEGMSRREATAVASEAIREALSALVADVSARTRVTLPTD